MERTYIDLIKRNGNTLTIEDAKVCMATHPDKPNHSGHARGRVMHLSLDGKKTICNMKYDGALEIRCFPRTECKICFKKYIS